MDIVIWPSASPWSFLVILKKKPDDTYRFLVDFRHLNFVTKKDVYPRPSVEELIYRLFRYGYFNKFDLEKRYFQILIIESDKEKTVFVTSDGHYEFNVLTQDLTNAFASFRGFMSNLIATLRWNYISIYFDNIDIFSHFSKPCRWDTFYFLCFSLWGLSSKMYDCGLLDTIS